jgi:hypothetical protein
VATNVTISLPDDTVAELRRIADSQSSSVNNYLSRLIRAHLAAEAMRALAPFPVAGRDVAAADWTARHAA